MLPVAFAAQYIVAKGLNSKPRACARDLLLLYTVANATRSICYTLLFIPAYDILYRPSCVSSYLSVLYSVLLWYSTQ
jgi:hypothetical protein